jgi:hypothetical protein
MYDSDNSRFMEYTVENQVSHMEYNSEVNLPQEVPVAYSEGDHGIFQSLVPLPAFLLLPEQEDSFGGQGVLKSPTMMSPGSMTTEDHEVTVGLEGYTVESMTSEDQLESPDSHSVSESSRCHQWRFNRRMRWIMESQRTQRCRT